MAVGRTPPERSDDLYPGLSVWGDRVSGSITIKDSRLPLWAIVFSAVDAGWARVEAGWSPTETYGYTSEDLAVFLSDLLEMRGEFGRLLLMLADAVRAERAEQDENAPWPDPWWQMPEITGPIVDQLHRCIESLTQPGPSD